MLAHTLRHKNKPYFFLHFASQSCNLIFPFMNTATGKLVVSELCCINEGELINTNMNNRTSRIASRAFPVCTIIF